MTIEEFSRRYVTDARPIDCAMRWWVAEKEARDFLGLTVMEGVTIADLLHGDGLVDTIPPEVQRAFGELMGPEVGTRADIERLIAEKLVHGGRSVHGLMNKIQGQLGEDMFVRQVGHTAELATNKSQEGWDVVVHHRDYDQYVQVKAYADVHQVVAKLQELQAKISAGTILGTDGLSLHALDVAVPSDIHDAVARQAVELGYPGHILSLRASHADFHRAMWESVDNVNHAFTHFFRELLGSGIRATALHASVNAFLVWKSAKDRHMALEDTLYSSGVSIGGLAVAHGTDQLFGHAMLLFHLHGAARVMSLAVPHVLVIVTAGTTTRAFLRRVADRRFVIGRLEAGNTMLAALTAKRWGMPLPGNCEPIESAPA